MFLAALAPSAHDFMVALVLQHVYFALSMSSLYAKPIYTTWNPWLEFKSSVAAAHTNSSALIEIIV